MEGEAGCPRVSTTVKSVGKIVGARRAIDKDLEELLGQGWAEKLFPLIPLWEPSEVTLIVCLRLKAERSLRA